MRPLLMALAVCAAVTAIPGGAAAAAYHVGQDQTYATVQDLLAAVTPGDGDVILVHPGTYPAFRVDKGGGSSPETAPVIRAYDRAQRPVFDAAGAPNCLEFQHPTGSWYAIEDLEICNASFRGVFNVQCGLVMRGCYVHDCRNGFMGGMHNTRDSTPGYLIAEHNEFAHNGSGAYAHQLYMQQRWVVFRYNWIHDNAGGSAYKDRSRESLVEYNLIEQGPEATYAIEFCGCDEDAAPSYTQTAVMVGNVVSKQGGGNRFLFLANERSEGGAEGKLNIGRLYLINNTFYSEDHRGPMLAGDDGSVIVAHNNIFHSTTSDRLLDQIMDATNRGRFEPSYRNWVRAGMEVPPELKETVSGRDPGFAKAAALGGDFHLLAGSACIDAGTDRVEPLPFLEYRHPCGLGFRPRDGKVDIGAFEARTGGAGR